MKAISLKTIAVLLGLPLCVAVADWAWTQGPVFQYRNDGVFAYYQSRDTYGEFVGSGVVIYGNRSATVQITESAAAMATGGVSVPHYRLSFSVSISTTTGFGAVSGSGPIPVEYVTSTRPNHDLALLVDTGLLGPPFFKSQFGPINIPYPTIDLRWERSANDWYRWEGHQVREIGDLIEHSQGSGVRYFALPSGTITTPDPGLPILSSYMDGWLGSEKTKIMAVQRGPGQ